MKLRVIYNYLLVRFGIRQVLPSDYIRSIQVYDNHEPIIALPPSSILIYDQQQKWEARVTVIDKLERVAFKLKEEQGVYIRLLELYRSPEKQQNMRDKQIVILQSQNPYLSSEQIALEANKRVSSIGGGHQTGGAVDLTLCDSKGRSLDMGTAYDEFNTETPTHAKGLSTIVKKNRRLLLRYMQQEGFANYPNEWWHFCYGDKMWAAYMHKPHAIYDVII